LKDLLMSDEDLLQPAPSIEINDLEALKFMSDPLRIRLVDLLRQAPATVKQLAAALEAAPRSLYYHINLLERHGLIRVVATRLVSGIQEKTYRATAYLFVYPDLSPGSGPAATEQAQEMVLSSFFNATLEEMRDSIRAGRIDLGKDAPEGRALCASWNLLRLTPGQATSLAARMDALLAEYPRYQGTVEADGSQVYRVLFTLFPTHHDRTRTQHADTSAR
jgi:DNA-binding transcriptional ArsR family regulator